MKKQSAFSLIEVLIALLILSIGVMGTSKMLLESTMSYQKAKNREITTIMVWSIANALYMDKQGVGLILITQSGQKRLDAIFPGSLLTIQRQDREDQCGYIVTIVNIPFIQPIKLWIAV